MESLRRLGQHSSMGFSYVKRINRPSFTDIAPFFLFIDPYTLFSGNPAVQPSTSNSFTIDYTIGPLSISSSFTSEKNALTKFQISVDTASNIQLIKPENLGAIRSFNSTVILPVRICRFWSSQNTIGGLWQEVDAGSFEHDEILDKWSLQLSSTQSVKLPANYSLEVTGFFSPLLLKKSIMIKQFSTSVVVIDQLMTEPEILFIFHRKFNKWMVPGGHVERSENPMECAVREVKEETGVTIEIISFIHKELKNKDSVRVMPPEYVFEQVIPASAEQEQHIHIDCVYVGVAIRKVIEVNYRETKGVQWIPLAKVWEMDLFDGTKAIIREIQRKIDSLFQARLANEKVMY